MDEFLDGLYNLAHPVLKRLKMDDSGVIPCSKQYPSQEVLMYVQGYAFHKHKWFEVRYDKATDAVHVKRTVPPSFRVTEEIDTEEEM